MKLILVFSTVLFSTNFFQTNGLTVKERNDAVALLESGRQKLLTEIVGLSEAQLKFKPSPDKWCIAEVMEHIGLTEMGIGEIVQQKLKTPADSTKRTEIKVTDEQIKQRLNNRSGKVQSPEIIKPTGRFTDIKQAIAFFTNARNVNIEFIQTTQEDLKDRYWQHPAT